MKWIVSFLTLWISATTNAFPVSIEHKYGQLTIEQQPIRIVSVGYSDQDDILSFGIVPVAIREWYGNQPYAVWPWAQSQLGDAQPVILKGQTLDYETIAALKPDLIIGVSSGMNQKEFNKLNSIAPTLAQSGKYQDWMIEWDIRHATIGKALGFTAQAQQNVLNLKKQISDAKLNHPEFNNKTAAVAFYYNKQPGAYSSKDLRSKFLIDLGFRIPKEIDTLAGESFYVSFSEERLDILDNDLLVWLDSEKKINAASTVAFRTRLPFYKQKREYFTDEIVGGAFSFFSPLSIQYLLDNMVPKLSEIAKRPYNKHP